MADRSLTYPRGVIEDVLVKVDKFIFPVDFVVLGMEEDWEIPIILGGPFLATGRALIDVHSGNLTLWVNHEEVKFNIYHTLKFPEERSTCNQIEVIDSCVKEFIRDIMHNDPLEHCLLNSLSTMDFGEEYYAKNEGVVDYVLALEGLPIEDPTAQVDTLDLVISLEASKDSLDISSSSHDGLVLKQLPEHL